MVPDAMVQSRSTTARSITRLARKVCRATTVQKACPKVVLLACFQWIRSLLLQSPRERNPQAEPKWTCLVFRIHHFVRQSKTRFFLVKAKSNTQLYDTPSGTASLERRAWHCVPSSRPCTSSSRRTPPRSRLKSQFGLKN